MTSFYAPGTEKKELAKDAGLTFIAFSVWKSPKRSDKMNALDPFQMPRAFPNVRDAG